MPGLELDKQLAEAIERAARIAFGGYLGGYVTPNLVWNFVTLLDRAGYAIIRKGQPVREVITKGEQS